MSSWVQPLCHVRRQCLVSVLVLTFFPPNLPWCSALSKILSPTWCAYIFFCKVSIQLLLSPHFGKAVLTIYILELFMYSGESPESKSFAFSFSPWSFVWGFSLIDFYAQKWLMEWKTSLCWFVLKNVETRDFIFKQGWARSVLWCFVEWHFTSKVALGLDQVTFWYMLYNPSSNLIWSRTGLNFCGEIGKKDAWPAVAGRWSHFHCLWCTCSMLF